MSTHTRPSITPQFVIGVFVTLAGVVLMLDRLIVDGLARQLRPFFWPVVLLTIGASMLAQRRDPSGRFWGSLWLVVGTWILLNALGWLHVTIWQMIGPLILILIGGTLLMHALRERRPPDRAAAWPPLPPGGPAGAVAGAASGTPALPNGGAAIPVQNDPAGLVSLFTVMGEAKRASNDKPFRGGEMTAFMGGCVLDLRQAAIEPGQEASVNILAIMAGHEIWVPSTWAVALDVVPMLGGVDDKRLPPLEPLREDAPRLRLKGFILMGGLVIRN